LDLQEEEGNIQLLEAEGKMELQDEEEVRKGKRKAV
jgi:hypothetical protein